MQPCSMRALLNPAEMEICERMRKEQTDFPPFVGTDLVVNEGHTSTIVFPQSHLRMQDTRSKIRDLLEGNDGANASQSNCRRKIATNRMRHP